MNSTRDPETMTADERRLEIASILAAGLLRRVGGPACVAKNRYGLIGDLPLTWAAFLAALDQSSTPAPGMPATPTAA